MTRVFTSQPVERQGGPGPSGATSSSRILSADPSEETFSSGPDAGRSEHRGHLSITAPPPSWMLPSSLRDADLSGITVSDGSMCLAHPASLNIQGWSEALLARPDVVQLPQDIYIWIYMCIYMRHTHTHARVIRWRERKPRPKKAAGSEEDRAADVGASAALFSAPQSGAARVHVHVRARFHVRRRTAQPPGQAGYCRINHLQQHAAVGTTDNIDRRSSRDGCFCAHNPDSPILSSVLLK